jgi:hypothetical protein
LVLISPLIKVGLSRGFQSACEEKKRKDRKSAKAIARAEDNSSERRADEAETKERRGTNNDRRKDNPALMQLDLS